MPREFPALSFLRFNPSQVGYKPLQFLRLACAFECFNPSQVGYKPEF